jgi:hypothetical protein
MKSDEITNFPPTLDLNELAKRYDITILVEPRPDPPEREANREQKRVETNYERRKDWMLFQVTLGLITALSVICIYSIFFNPVSSDSFWPKVTLTAIVTGILGYLFGRAGTQIRPQRH